MAEPMRSIGELVLVLAMALAVGCDRSPSGPSPEQVCQRMADLARAEGAAAAEVFARRMAVDCRSRMAEERTRRGEPAWQKLARCIDAATSFTAAGTNCQSPAR